MNKKQYELPEIQVVLFGNEEVGTVDFLYASGGSNTEEGDGEI